MNEMCFYHMSFPVALYTLTGIFSMLGVCQVLTHVLGARILSVAAEVSRLINEFYIVHWIVIDIFSGFACYGLGVWLDVYAAQLAALPILVASFFLARKSRAIMDRTWIAKA